ncbi:hemerythrin domain-containing protein [Aeromicrobium wangtongii]|uniref:Hemerythrin domain-containing protein n=1 Tax=Aeromicrobium wangtongii TaxID=2969247 RepID=A0ABY5M4Y9_9ACTN|nr:hemerythrin domain-containing protein [Aeromicrobium wangtongii]MCD9198720.1 hemerythrin domain-containing protein [Aeromicrobium wangtongii]UUP13234.1 hemerythrin domain-containing protein [Aeromicrobium wangtongii]
MSAPDPHPTPTDGRPGSSPSLAGQDERRLGGTLSVLVRQKRDHVELDRLLHELGSAAPNAQDDVLRRLYRLVFSHAFAEEAVLWPVIRRVLPDGEALTLQVEREHQEVNEIVTEIEATAAGSAERQPLLDRLVAVLREDVRDEEDELLPRLQARLDVHRLRALGLAWETVRRTAPTRAHPVVARRPPGNVLAAVPLTVIDRLRDRVDRHIQHGRGPAPRLHDASRLLTRAAHAVEHAPLLRRGEDPSTAAERP